MFKKMYPYFCKFENKTFILIWITSEQDGDLFLKSSNNLLFVAKNKEEIAEKLPKETICWDEENTVIDLEVFKKTLEKTLENKPMSKRTCSIILSGWNFFEDYIRTFKLEKDYKRFLKNAEIKNLYEKIFWGNNISSVTPKKKHYKPILIEEEVVLLKKSLSILMDDFRVTFQKSIVA